MCSQRCFFPLPTCCVVTFVDDHFGMSLFFLSMTLYLAGKQQKEHQGMPWWQTALLFFFTAGITLSNGAKTFLAALFTNGKKLFPPEISGIGHHLAYPPDRGCRHLPEQGIHHSEPPGRRTNWLRKLRKTVLLGLRWNRSKNTIRPSLAKISRNDGTLHGQICLSPVQNHW